MHDSQNGRPIGRVVGLSRYPVKSMAGEPLAEIDVSWHGFAGDRRWAFIRDGVTQGGFPWLTLREREDMSHYSPSFVDPADVTYSGLTPGSVGLWQINFTIPQSTAPVPRIVLEAQCRNQFSKRKHSLTVPPARWSISHLG